MSSASQTVLFSWSSLWKLSYILEKWWTHDDHMYNFDIRCIAHNPDYPENSLSPCGVNKGFKQPDKANSTQTSILTHLSCYSPDKHWKSMSPCIPSISYSTGLIASIHIRHFCHSPRGCVPKFYRHFCDQCVCMCGPMNDQRPVRVCAGASVCLSEVPHVKCCFHFRDSGWRRRPGQAHRGDRGGPPHRCCCCWLGLLALHEENKVDTKHGEKNTATEFFITWLK